LPVLRVRTLGGFQVWRGGEALPARAWRRSRAANLFKFLLGASGYRATRDHTLVALWPDIDARRGAQALRSALSELRKALGAPATGDTYVRTDGAWLCLDPAPGATPVEDWDDAGRFLHAARYDLAAHSRPTCPRASALYTGVYLPDDRYAPWTESRRAAVHDLHRRLLMHQAALAVETAEIAQVEIDLRGLLADDPTDEPAAQALMSLLEEAGRPAEAHRVYLRPYNALIAEMGASPSVDSQALSRQLREALYQRACDAGAATDWRSRCDQVENAAMQPMLVKDG